MLNIAQPVRVQEVPAAETAVAPKPTLFFGYTLRETAGSTAVVVLYDAASAAGRIVGEISLAANAAAERWYGPNGLQLTTGIFYHVASGTVEGSVFVL